ncbi:serine/threonine-protein kinase [Nonomuraea sp. 10N515B]|uniref:serine/threonine-protein kinase n=1 Tax=Nonomuraea sp. 10N515B TaxID=3457422 RepID=UPI003FCC5969
MVAQGTTLAGRYRLDTRIGAGGMGEVWRGEDIVLARTVAVKVLLPGRMEDPGFVARFQGEARAMATINHAGVVDVYDYGVSGDTVYLVMKFVDGEPLDRLLSRLGRIPPQAAMELIAQAASALQAVHDQGIVHRDVKPGNLLVQRDGTLVLTDFGIARSDLANRLTDAGMVLGTAAYCAPEQAEGAPVTPAVDIYALGVVAYECLVGQRPFDGDSAVTIALKHIREAPPPLPPSIPPAVRTLVEIALSKDPARRYPTAKAMSEAARAIASGQAPEPVQPPVTGATMVPPTDYPPRQTGQYAASPHQTGQYDASSHQTGQYAADPYQTGVRMAPSEETTVAERRGRRAAKAPRRTGLIAGIAAVVVLGAGATAVALTGMTTGDPMPTNTAINSGDSESSPSPSPKPKRTKPTREPTPDPKPTTTRPRPTKTEKAETPTPTPSKTPTPTPSKTSSGTPTPTVKKVLVPKVVGMPIREGEEMVVAAGFDTRVIDNTSTTAGMQCGKIQKTNPAGGTPYDVTKPVTLVVIDGICSTPSATPGVTATPK